MFVAPFAWLRRRGSAADDYVFPSRLDHSSPMSTRQYARLVDEWVTAIRLRREVYERCYRQSRTDRGGARTQEQNGLSTFRNFNRAFSFE